MGKLTLSITQNYKGSQSNIWTEDPAFPVNWGYIGVGIILLVGGYLWLTMSDKDNSSGCVGGIIMMVGAALLIPLLQMLANIFSVLFGIGLSIFVVLLIVFGIYSLIKK